MEGVILTDDGRILVEILEYENFTGLPFFVLEGGNTRYHIFYNVYEGEPNFYVNDLFPNEQVVDKVKAVGPAYGFQFEDGEIVSPNIEKLLTFVCKAKAKPECRIL